MIKKSGGEDTDDGVEIEKSNVIMVGETGTGKTLLAKTIAKLLNVPFAIVDATVFTEAGYVGEDVESILTRLLQVCNYDVDAAEKGIVYIRNALNWLIEQGIASKVEVSGTIENQYAFKFQIRILKSLDSRYDYLWKDIQNQSYEFDRSKFFITYN